MQLSKYKELKRKRTQAPLTSSHGSQNFCYLFPSKGTTRGKASFPTQATQQHFKCDHQSTNKQASQLSRVILNKKINNVIII